MSHRVFVTGTGIISAIGTNLTETFESLKFLKSGIGKISNISTIHSDIPFGEVKFTNRKLSEMAGVAQTNKIYSRTTLLAIIAAKEALKKHDLKGKIKTGLISATTVGGVNIGEDHFADFIIGRSNPELIELFDCGESTEALADFLGIRGYLTTISTACSSSANSIILGARLIKNHIIDRAVAGGTDSLSKFTINGFNTLEILDHDHCKPFDENRHGLNIGEGAAYLMLEAEDIADPASVICEFKGYGVANDAYHQTASSPEGHGAFLAMSEALKCAGLKPNDISYINAHGTATEINDLSEGRAIDKLFSPDFPLISSTKPYTGHTLGAAGAIEAVISMLSMKNNLIFPNMNWKSKMKEITFSPVTELLDHDAINHVMSNSFGFGGHNSSLIFSKC